MGIKQCFDEGEKIWLTFDCVGYSKEDIVAGKKQKLRVPLKKATEKMGITFSEINEVKYAYNPVDIDYTIEELNIINGGIITIKLKSKF